MILHPYTQAQDVIKKGHAKKEIRTLKMIFKKQKKSTERWELRNFPKRQNRKIKQLELEREKNLMI